MNLYLILEIALLYGHDIEDRARVSEMMTVVAASGLTAGTPFLIGHMGWQPLVAMPTSGLTSSVVTQMIGAAAIRLYEKKHARADQLAEELAEISPGAVPVG